MILQSKVEVNPRDAEALAYLASFLAMVGKQKAALDYLQKALNLAPSDGLVLFRAAIVYNHYNQLNDAVAYLTKAASVGYSRQVMRDTPDFQALQENPQFKALVSAV